MLAQKGIGAPKMIQAQLGQTAMKGLIPLVVFCLLKVSEWGVQGVNAQYLQTYKFGVDAANLADYTAAATHLNHALNYIPTSVEALHLLGVVVYKLGNVNESLSLLGRATDLSNFSDLSIVANYVEILRSSGNIKKAREVGRLGFLNIGDSCDRDCLVLLFNTAVVEVALQNIDKAIDLLIEATSYDPTAVEPWHLLRELLIKRSPAFISHTVSSTLIPIVFDQVTNNSHADEQPAPASNDLGTRRSAFLDLTLKGQFDAALPVALSLYQYYNHFPLYLVEVGLIYVYMGRYAEGLPYCLQAQRIDANSALVHSCLGLAHMYTSTAGDTAAEAFTRAIALTKLETAAVQRVLRDRVNVTSVEIQDIEQVLGILSSPAFESPLYSVEGNLMQTFSSHSMHEQCVEWFIEANALPPVLEGTAYIMTLALVAWSPVMRGGVDTLERALRGAGQFRAAPHVTLWDEIRRVQRSRKDMLSAALDCMRGLNGDGKRVPFLPAVIQDLMTLMRYKEAADDARISAQVDAPILPLASNDEVGVALILQIYMPDDPAKRQDISAALQRNLENEHISDIYLLNEAKLNIDGFLNQHKIHQHVTEKRLTFKMAFEFANEHLVNRTVIIANSDIFFDETLCRITGTGARRPQLGAKNTILALLKWVYNQKSGTISMPLRTDSQDAWVFQPPVDARIVQDLDFYMGVPRCDNRIVAVFQKHQYTVLDPVFAVRASELDSIVRTQHLYDTKNVVVGDTDTLLLSDQFEF